jgi:hypothetical protein
LTPIYTECTEQALIFFNIFFLVQSAISNELDYPEINILPLILFKKYTLPFEGFIFEMGLFKFGNFQMKTLLSLEPLAKNFPFLISARQQTPPP